LREQGVESLAEVKVAYLEGDGQISVIQREKSAGQSSSPRKSAAAGGR